MIIFIVAAALFIVHVSDVRKVNNRGGFIYKKKK